ncbi:MAG: bifunctional phosphoribosylaminoimidazolecarboxamide formyltransferase/IMP cyclohydrolase [Deltaproteobacteria bacterium]|nr:bifunctional phosphoribosylaminoimidazolecarboxamide formyltransferase/IMP cyclohydrolase [Deltaproteobacteria bacterium]
MSKIKRAIISVSDKKGIVSFANGLSKHKVTILSTGGTAKMLRENGIEVEEVSHYTGFPEMLDGRVKTLHPKIHGGLLGQRSNPEHVKKMEEHGIESIDMILVNLYPFEATIAKETCSLEEAIENIDIGGPTMLRSAAKNYPDVTVIVDPEDYKAVLDEMEETQGEVSVETNFRLAKKVFQLTARYDGAISNYLGSLMKDGQKDPFPETVSFQFAKTQGLRYGENPHQQAAFYRASEVDEPCVSGATKLQGKELSFNNILDADAAIETVKEFEETAVVVIKHTNPCGVAVSSSSLADAYRKAKSCDPVSAFGGIVASNREVDEETAKEITSIFTEVVIAPDYSEEALKVLSTKKDLRVLKVPFSSGYDVKGFDMRKVVGGMLVQDRDLGKVDITQCKVVTKRNPTPEEYKAMEFAWKVCKHVKSNAIIYAVQDQTVGIGAGQMSRIDSSKIAVDKAQFSIKGTIMASDAMFPFRDSVDEAAKAGATAIIQPGGSIRDKEVIQAADEANMTMIFTGMRHFRH